MSKGSTFEVLTFYFHALVSCAADPEPASAAARERSGWDCDGITNRKLAEVLAAQGANWVVGRVSWPS